LQVAVVIPNYNYGQWLGQCIKSVRAQEYQLGRIIDQIIVVDGGSTDDSVSVAKELGVECIVDPIGSCARHMNTGIKAAEFADFVVTLHSDDWLEPNFIDSCLAMVKSTTGLVATGMQWEELDTIMWPGPPGGVQLPDEPITLPRLLMGNRLFCCNLIRRAAWVDVGGFDVSIGFEDWDFWIRVVAAGYGVEVINEPLFHHRAHPHSGMSQLDENAAYRCRSAIRAKHAPLLALHGL